MRRPNEPPWVASPIHQTLSIRVTPGAWSDIRAVSVCAYYGLFDTWVAERWCNYLVAQGHEVRRIS